MNRYRITIDIINGSYSPAMNVNQFNFLSLDSIRKFDCGVICKGIWIDSVIKVRNYIVGIEVVNSDQYDRCLRV